MIKGIRGVLLLSCIYCGVGGVACSAVLTNESPQTVGVPRTAEWTVSSSADGRRILFSVKCDGVSLVPVDGGISIRMPGQAGSAGAGTPDVPHLSKLMTGVKGARASLVVRGLDPTNLMNMAVAPAEGFRLDESGSGARVLKPYRQVDSGVYGKDEFWPVELGTLEAGAIGTQHVVRVVCFPVQYNPVKGALRFFRRLEGEVRFENM